MKSGVACGYHATPVICAVKKKTPPLFIIGGLNEMKPGSVMDIMLPHDLSPPSSGGDGSWGSIISITLPGFISFNPPIMNNGGVFFFTAQMTEVA